jgi:hypothetical protein
MSHPAGASTWARYPRSLGRNVRVVTVPFGAGGGATGADGAVELVAGRLDVGPAVAVGLVARRLDVVRICRSALPARPPDDWKRETPSAVATPMTGRGPDDVGTEEADVSAG